MKEILATEIFKGLTKIVLPKKIMYKIKLSPYAKTFYVEWMLNPKSNLYNVVVDQTLYGDLDVKKLKKALKKYIADHLILNSHIKNIDEKTYWVKNDKIHELELSDKPTSTQELLEYVNRGFNLHKGPLYRFKLLRIKNKTYRFILVFHHLVLDGSSMDAGVFEEISNYYNNKNFTTKYSIDDQIKLISNLTENLYGQLNQNKNKYEKFWTKQLDDIDVVDLKFLKLDNKKTNTILKDNPIKEIKFCYKKEELTKLNKVKIKHPITTYNYGQIIFALLIHKYTNQNNFAINYGAAIKEGLDFIYGTSVNTNLIPYRFDQSTAIKDLIDQTKEFFSSIKKNNTDHSYYPITEILRKKNNQLLNLRFIKTILRDTKFKFDNITKVKISKDFDVDSVDPFLFEQESKNQILNFRIRYNKELIDEKLLKNFVKHYKKLFLEVLDDLINNNANKKISEYKLLDAKEYNKLIYDWNESKTKYPHNKTIHELFQKQASKTPHNIAIKYIDKELTYKELNNKANQLANYLLHKHKIKPDDLIVLYLDRSEQMLISILAVLKAGGAYVPISTSSPKSRTQYILQDTKPKAIITNSENQDKLSNKNIINIGKDNIQKKLAKEKTTNPKTSATCNNLMYVIHTSGTTGNPKGVLQQHNNVMRLFASTNKWFDFNDKDVWTLFHSYTFDFTIWEIWGALLYGGKLIIPTPGQIKDTEQFYKLCLDEKVTILAQTPQAFYTFIDVATKHFKNARLQNLRLITFGGEALNLSNLQPWTSLYGYNKPKLINMFGITETTVHVTYKKITKKDMGENSYIGEAIPDQKLYVLNDNLTPLPIGAIGELYVGGAGLARGYLNQPKLTKKRFIPNPFQTSKEKSKNINDRIYKTGDLVRWLPKKDLEYIGRNDEQIKIRGFRIELAEIEKKLLGYPQITRAAILVKEKNNKKYLAAYYASSKKISQSKLKDYLLSQLPDYTTPNIFIRIKTFPLTKNGKLDKKSLPEPNLLNKSKYTAPNSKLEKKICEIYANILQLPIKRMGITNSFFDMGGDSISSIQITLKIRQQLGLEVKTKDIFDHKTIENLVKNVLEKQKRTKKANKPKKTSNQTQLNKTYKNPKIDSVYLANSLQQGFIYHAIRQNRIDNAYLSQFVWEYATPINKDKLKKAWQLTQEKYPSLRLRFAWDNELIQIIDKKQELDFRHIDLSTLRKKTDYKLKNIIKKDSEEHYNLQKGQLFRVYLIKLPKNRYSCIYSAHHIIIDAWSFSLLINNVHNIYSDLLANKKPRIIGDIAYKKAQQYLQEHKNQDQEYWDNHIDSIENRLDLKSLLKPTAIATKIRNHLAVKQEQEQFLEIKEQDLIRLKNICKINAITPNAVIQYIWHKILYLHGSSKTTVVGTVVSNRNIPVNNIENSVGLFINTLPLIHKHHNKPNIIEQIKSIQDSINEITNKSNINLADLQPKSDRLFDSLISYENYPHSKYITNIELEKTQEIFRVDYPIAITACERKKSLIIKFKYAGELFNQKTISQILNKMLYLMRQILKNPYTNKLKYLNQEEYQSLVLNYNKTEKTYPRTETIHSLFEKQAKKTPNNIAVTYKNNKLTYKELNNQANKLANYLHHNYHIKSEDLVILCIDRNEQMPIALLATLKAGGAYVPIAPNQPIERINYILNDTKANIILTSNKHKDKLQKIVKQKRQNINVIAIDDNKTQKELSKQKGTNPAMPIKSSNLIYTIYTSGTTGNPKGVLVEHRSVINYITYLISYTKLNNKHAGSQYANIGFDAFGTEVYPILVSGGNLCIIPEEIKMDLSQINNFFHANNIKYGFLPTKIAELFFNLKNNSLNYLVVGGEKLNSFSKQNYKIINAYGPTETTIQPTLFEVNKQYDNIPIGKPINNVKCYVVDNNLDLLPTNTIGELLIGGECLARGYLNRPNLTAEKFISNPFQTEKEKTKNKNHRLYKTGDLARWLPNGNLEFLGRNDDQIKIRGFRIEPGEITNKLLNHPSIQQAVIIQKKEKNNECLVAYYTASNELAHPTLYNYLSQQLPNYMIPDVFIYIEKMPLTKNGKLDKNSLSTIKINKKESYIEPRDIQESLVCDAFSKTLNIQKISVNDDFFSLGGNSILAIKLNLELQKNFDIKLADIFELRIPKKIAKISFGNNFLQKRLEQIKLFYKEKQNSDNKLKEKIKQKRLAYLKSIKDLKIDPSQKKPIHNVLLTGATGYLGCNILNQLLKLTDYKIYLPIRAKSKSEAIKRINKKHQFYFDETLDNTLEKRVFAFNADIEQNNLGLSQSKYNDLTTKIDSTIHAAALVKHYGEYDKSYSANVNATINLLEFTKLTKLKDFHYISTIGIMHLASMLNSHLIYTENTQPQNTKDLYNVYIETKLQGEHEVIKYRDLGLNCNIYRAGNLAFMLKSFRIQENIEDNAFYNWLKYLFSIKHSSEKISTIEISPADLSAQAIVKIFDNKNLSNQTYHTFNPNFLNITSTLKKNKFKILPIDKFFNFVTKHIDCDKHNNAIARFLLHQGWLDSWKQCNKGIKILQNKTQHILKQLGFEWPIITEEVLDNYFTEAKLNVQNEEHYEEET